jgi:hypothetical protein
VVHARRKLLACLLVPVAAGGALACFTAPPPDLPAESASRPTILSSSAFPPGGALLTTLPPDGTFVVPVQVGAGGSFQWDVYVDYDPVGPNPNPNYGNPRIAPSLPTSADETDGGVVPVSFLLSESDFQPGICPHRIEFFVAHQFDPSSARTPQSYGGDSIAWSYEPAGCLDYDAGDGAFPQDAPQDGLPIAPESGTDP